MDVAKCDLHTGLPHLLGPTNPCPNAVHMEPFSTSVFKVLFWIFATTTKRCVIFQANKFTIKHGNLNMIHNPSRLSVNSSTPAYSMLSAICRADSQSGMEISTWFTIHQGCLSTHLQLPTYSTTLNEVQCDFQCFFRSCLTFILLSTVLRNKFFHKMLRFNQRSKPLGRHKVNISA